MKKSFKKEIKKEAVWIIALASLFAFTSCDILLPAPISRDNPYDDEAQINSFRSLFAGNDSAEVIWNWDAFAGTDPSMEIVKIRIVHKVNDPPMSMSPLDKDNVKEFTSGESFLWENLKEYNDHYFALYQMEKSGRWLKPLYTQFHLEGPGYLDGSNIPSLNYLYADMVSGTTVHDNSPPLDKAYRGFFKIDTGGYDNMGKITEAYLKFAMNGSNIVGHVWIVPMKKDVHSGELWDDISSPGLYDMSHAVYADVSNTVDITVHIDDVLNYCLVYGTKTFALIIPESDPGMLFNPAADISIDYFQYWSVY